MKIIINPDNFKVYLEDINGSRMLLSVSLNLKEATNFAVRISEIIKVKGLFIQGESNKISIPLE